MVVVLPLPFTPTTSTTKGLWAGSGIRGLATGSSSLAMDPARISRISSLADLLVEAVAAQLLHELRGGGRSEIGGDQQILELGQRLLVEAALDEDAGDALAEARGGTLETGGEPAEPTALLGHAAG